MNARLDPALPKYSDVREVICHGYRILYWRANDERIDILGVKNSRQDLSLPANQPWEAH